MIKDLVASMGKSEYVFQCTFNTLLVIYSPFFCFLSTAICCSVFYADDCFMLVSFLSRVQ